MLIYVFYYFNRLIVELEINKTGFNDLVLTNERDLFFEKNYFLE